MRVTGSSDSAIAETAAFFLGLEGTARERSSFHLSVGGSFDFCAAGSRCLAQMLEFAPSRGMYFRDILFSATQSTVLATRLQPTRLTLSSCRFEDGGTAFVDALEIRKSPLESLSIRENRLFNDDNLKRLLNTDVLEELWLPRLSDELAFLPFFAKVDSLEYDISAAALLKEDFQSVNILAKKLSITVYEETESVPAQSFVCLWRRMAAFGHFDDLKVNLRGFEFERRISVPDCVVQEVIRATLANSNLKVLNLFADTSDLDLDRHLKKLFHCSREHKSITNFEVYVHENEKAFGPDYLYLRQLLSHNRIITVTDEDGNILARRPFVYELYSFNRFYRGSAGLAVEPSSERPLLVATALVTSASYDFRRSALLLSNHIDALCELVEFARLDDLLEAEVPTQSNHRGNRPKRRRRRM